MKKLIAGLTMLSVILVSPVANAMADEKSTLDDDLSVRSVIKMGFPEGKDYGQILAPEKGLFYSNSSETDTSDAPKKPPAHIRAVGLISMEADVEELDPFWGVGAYGRNISSNAISMPGLDVLFGSGIMEMSYGGTTVRQEFDDFLIILSYNHGFLTGASKYKNIKDGIVYLVAGGGIAYEDAVVETEILGTKIEEDISGFGFLLNFGIGYSQEKIDFLALYTMIPGSGNVTGALYLSLGLEF